MTKREPREISFAEIRNVFTLAGYWFGNKWCPAVDTKDGGGYSVRILRSENRNGINVSTTYDYFELDPAGVILVAPRGYAKDFKPCRVTDIAEVAQSFVLPDPDARRINLGGLS